MKYYYNAYPEKIVVKCLEDPLDRAQEEDSMGYDQSTYDFAKLWLAAGGWNNEIDADKLAQLIEDLCRDFVMELQEEYDREQPH